MACLDVFRLLRATKNEKRVGKILVMPFALTVPTTEPLKVGIFHICHVDNLASILNCGKICSLNVLQERHITPRSIAYGHIQERRHKLEVPIDPGGTLHGYVPWSFAARSPMLYTTWSGGLKNGTSQTDILHFSSNVGQIVGRGLSSIFTDGHPVTTGFTRYSSDLTELPDFLDWEVLQSRMWGRTDADPDRPRRRQAEFLIQGEVPWDVVRGIAVRTQAMRDKVAQIIQNHSHQPKILVLPEWYY